MSPADHAAPDLDATDDAVPDADATAPIERPAPTRERRRPTWPMVIVLVALLALSVAAAIVQTVRRDHSHEQADAASQVRQVAGAATAVATAVLSYDAAHLDQAERRVDTLTTTSFARSWHQTFVQSESGTITATDAISTPQIDEVYVSSVNGADAGAIVVADFQVKTRTGTTKVSGAYLRLTMKHQRGVWKADTLNLVVGPQSSAPGQSAPAGPSTTPSAPPPPNP